MKMESKTSKPVPNHQSGPSSSSAADFFSLRDFANRLLSTTQGDTTPIKEPNPILVPNNSPNLPTRPDDVPHFMNTTQKKKTHENGGRKKATFWTVCPYCYNMYEYEKVYEECCLRCCNCEKAFHGVAIVEPGENVLVEGKNQYYCGFGVFGLKFALHVSDDEKKKENGNGFGNNVVEISDDEEEGVKQGNVSEKKTEVRKERKKKVKSVARKKGKRVGENGHVVVDESDFEFF